MQQYQPYNIDTQIYSENKYIAPDSRCFAYMFTNVGDTPASINGMVIFPSATPATALGDSRTISGHEGDVYKGSLVLKFEAPFGTAPRVEFVQLFYI